MFLVCNNKEHFYSALYFRVIFYKKKSSLFRHRFVSLLTALKSRPKRFIANWMVCDSLMYLYHDTEKGKQVKENDSFYTQDNTQLPCIVKLTLPSVAVHEKQKRITAEEEM